MQFPLHEDAIAIASGNRREYGFGCGGILFCCVFGRTAVRWDFGRTAVRPYGVFHCMICTGVLRFALYQRFADMQSLLDKKGGFSILEQNIRFVSTYHLYYMKSSEESCKKSSSMAIA
jgi:hypothetical protein